MSDVANLYIIISRAMDNPIIARDQDYPARTLNRTPTIKRKDKTREYRDRRNNIKGGILRNDIYIATAGERIRTEECNKELFLVKSMHIEKMD